MEKKLEAPKAEKEPKAKETKLTLASLAAEVREYKNGYDELKSMCGEMYNNLTALERRCAELTQELDAMKSSGGIKVKGPKSQREMTEEDARRVRFGDLKDVQVRKAAEILGLSYGQVYSARGEYTFKGLSEKPKGEGKN